MPVENDGENIQAKPLGGIGGAPLIPANPDAKPNESSTEKLEKDIKRGEWWLIRIGIATLVINTVIALIYVRQLQEMRAANKLTSDALGVAAQNSLESSKQFQAQLSHFDVSMGRTELLAIHAGEQAKAGQDAANAAKRNANIAQKTLQATIDSFHDEDRAWVGISEAKPLSYNPNITDKSVSMTVAFTLRNYGRSAAEHVRFLAVLESDPTVYSLSCNEVAAKNHSGDVLLPTQERTLNWSMVLTPDQMAKGWAHQNPQLGNILSLRIVGCIEYSDRDAEALPHRTPFTYIVGADGWYTTPDKAIPSDQIHLHQFGTDTNQTH